MIHTKITISDKNGTKSYTFSENFIFQLKILAVFVAVFFLVLLFALFKIYSNNTNLKNLNRNIYAQNIQLSEEKIALLTKSDEASKRLYQHSLKMADLESDLQIALALNDVKNEIKTKKERNNLQTTDSVTSVILSQIPNGLPMKYRGTTSEFGMRIHPISGKNLAHHGIDLRASEGTPVYATADGFVEFSSISGGYGNLIILSHNYGFKTRYGHLYKSVVSVGDYVKKGTLIAYSGNTGYSTGPHLHYEVRFLERPLNPANFMAWNISNFARIPFAEPNVSWQEIAAAISQKR